MESIFVRAKILLICCTCFIIGLSVQCNPANRASPPAEVSGRISDANLHLSYSSPGVKGREIWGGLVPYGKIWRAGANEATIFETDQDIMVEGQVLPAGNYSLFAIPGEKEWTFIFNSETGQWGTTSKGEANLDAENNVLTVTVEPVETNTMVERLAYDINSDGFLLKWEYIEVPVSITR